MKHNVIVSGAFALSMWCLVAYRLQESNQTSTNNGWLEITNSPPTWTNAVIVKDYHPEPMTNFLTISNRPYLRLENCDIMYFTEEEWRLVTNYWSDYITTQRFPIILRGPISHAPK